MSDSIKLDVRAYPIKEPKNKTVAFASVTINDMIGINGIQVIDGRNGLFAQMPQTKDAKGEYRDIAFPVTKELRQELNSAVIAKYIEEKAKVSVKEEIKGGQTATKEASAPVKDAPAAGKGKSSKKTAQEH
ncbi:MAG: SpoVG family protein [Oscillospiraceae bacterium]|nr:SpoVG family protein [Oscillospiraceae bacterium]